MTLSQAHRQLQITTPLGENYVLLKEFSASETISELFSFQMKLVHEENAINLKPTVIDPKAMLGQPVSVQVNLKGGTARYFNGVVSHWRQGNRDTRFTYYQAILVPKVWMLTQKYQSRIFQRLTVPQILKKVFSGFSVKQELVGTFNRREYCVQYNETDFDFAARLMEEEGIYYFFEHTASDHQMILANTPQSHRDCPTQTRFPFEADQTRTDGVVRSIATWETAYQLQTGKISVWDHNFELPHRKLEADQPTLYAVGGNASLIHQYTGDYAKRYTGVDPGAGDQSGELQHIFEDNQHQAEVQMQALDARYNVAHGTSNCCPLTVGNKFEIFNHAIKEVDGQYLLTRVSHFAVQSPDLSTEERDVVDAYQNNFDCIPLKSGSTPFRPIRKTAKSKVSGSQTAVVVGPAGEEIFTDKYGRIKVQFHWDREGKYDPASSCWMRVTQPWAGGNWGTICIPRIGQEVVVEFLEGDPDRPIVTGSVYNPAQMPPYELPKEKTKSTTKSNSSLGGGGFNELRFEDKKGHEQIFLHAERDLDHRVEFDARYWTGHDSHQIVERDETIEIKRDRHETVARDSVNNVGRDLHLSVNGKTAVSIDGSFSLNVNGNTAENHGGNHSESTTGVHSLRGGMLVIEGIGGISLRSGASFITITPAGIALVGPIIQSLPPIIPGGGAPLTAPAGQLVSPQKPRPADIADDAVPGIASVTPSHDPQKNKEKISWIEIKLVDEETGEPIAGEPYRVTLTDGTTLAEGTLDEKGEARIECIDPGSCRVTFPNREREAWRKA